MSEVFKTSETLEFTYKMSKDSTEEKTCKLVVDMSSLTTDQVLEWAFSAMVVSFQGKLRGKTPPTPEADGSYKWAVPARGTRLVADPAKMLEKATELVNKMNPELKYNMMIQLGLTAAMASAATGFTPPVEVKK